MTQYSYAPTIRLADIASRSRQPGGHAIVPRRIRVLLNVAGDRIMRGHTINVGVDRLTVSVPSALETDQECAVFFGLTIEDHIYSIIGTGRVLGCMPSDNGFRAEMHFIVEDRKSRIALEQLFGDKQSVCVQ